ncbi:MAG: IS21 family transposase [Actinomycetota bacterium]|nr:IS21 family transposase [Actinomycetota bacterium]
MDSRVELFEQIRRDHDREGLSVRGLARRHDVHRRAVRQALESAVPPARKRPVGRPAPKLGEYRELIDSWLIADRTAPRKQRHTAKRIWERLRDEHGVEVSERQVRRYVRERRRALGVLVDEVFVPLCSDPGAEAEVDWGEATVIIAGVSTRVYLFVMRACFSGACFVQAHTRATQQAFLEGHVAAFEFFGGTFGGVLRYDNLKSAVVKVLKGRRREESDRFVALRSHYLYESSFTRRGKEGAHEKGGVEGEVGRFRRAHLVPVPEVGSLQELNERIAASCIADLGRTIRGRSLTVGEALQREVERLRSLPAEPFDSCEHATPRVDSKSLATVRQNQYSLPVGLAGLRVAARIGAREIVFCHDGRRVACHERLEGKFHTSAQLDHYLDLLKHKPGALPRSLALRQEREQGRWPDSFDQLWQAIESKVGSSEAAGQMVDVLLLCRELGPAGVELAVRGALAAGAHDGRAVAVLARRAQRIAPAPLSGLDARLVATERPEPDLGDYDQLLGKETVR